MIISEFDTRNNEGSALLNDAYMLFTVIWRRYMVKDDSDIEMGNPLPPCYGIKKNLISGKIGKEQKS